VADHGQVAAAPQGSSTATQERHICLLPRHLTFPGSTIVCYGCGRTYALVWEDQGAWDADDETVPGSAVPAGEREVAAD
jgi:hypothetical protein